MLKVDRWVLREHPKYGYATYVENELSITTAHLPDSPSVETIEPLDGMLRLAIKTGDPRIQPSRAGGKAVDGGQSPARSDSISVFPRRNSVIRRPSFNNGYKSAEAIRFEKIAAFNRLNNEDVPDSRPSTWMASLL